MLAIFVMAFLCIEFSKIQTLQVAIPCQYKAIIILFFFFRCYFSSVHGVNGSRLTSEVEHIKADWL